MAVYFDNAATTSPCKKAVQAFFDTLSLYGNPSSPHGAGVAARSALDKARSTLAALAGVKKEEFYFTASGTESNNTAIFGLAALKARHSRRIVLTNSEHPSVTECARAMEKNGSELIFIPTHNGAVDMDALKDALAQKTALVCVMGVNNETGAIYDLKAVREVIDKSGCGAYLHCDAVQAFMKVPQMKQFLRNADTVSLSAHKLHAPRGIGGLTVKSGIRLPAYIHGGGQEKGLRSGTENVAGAVAFAVAAEEYTAERLAHIKAVRERITENLQKAGNVGFNVPERHIDGILNISLYGIKSETALNCLSAEEIYISASSACSARKGVSGVLTAYGLEKAGLESALRIGISYENTFEDADRLTAALISARERYGRI